MPAHETHGAHACVVALSEPFYFYNYTPETGSDCLRMSDSRRFQTQSQVHSRQPAGQICGGDPFTAHPRLGRPACGRLVRDALEPSMGARRPPSMAPDGPEHVGAKNLSPYSPSGLPNAVLIRTVGCKNQPLCLVLGGEWIKAQTTMIIPIIWISR